MDNQINNQGNPLPKHVRVFLAMRERGLIQIKVAKALKVTQGAISQALNGENPGLVDRIEKYIKRYDRARARRNSNKREVA